ncbi:MAG: AIM24 family protein [Gammaproteobacteria bacterium]|nr:AIM24 family protein [Gammaproteobacteria bacterium]
MDDWTPASAGIRYRVEGGGVRVTLPEGQAMVAEADRLLYRGDGVNWSLAVSSAGRIRGWVNRIQRRAVALPGRMSRYEGPGEVAFAAGAPAEVQAVEFVRGDNLVVAAPAFLAAAAGVQIDVALVEKVRDEGERRTLVMYRLTGEGLALLAASGDALRVHLRPDEAVEAAAWAGAWYDATGGYELRVLGGRRGNHVARITGPARVVVQTAWPPVR